MKRIRFSVRLMLLLTSLIAVSIIAVRSLLDLHRLQSVPKQMALQTKIDNLVRQRNQAVDLMSNSDPQYRNSMASFVGETEEQITKLQKQLSEMQP